jgi:hypothetical protein
MQKKRLVFCDTYAYGPGEKISSGITLLHRLTRVKPAIRAKVHEMMFQHMTQQYLTAVVAAQISCPHVTDNKGLSGRHSHGQDCQGVKVPRHWFC